MRRALPLLASAGAVLLGGGLVWAYAERAGGVHSGVTLLLVAGTLLALVAIIGTVAVERRPGGLAVPDGTALPAPGWPWPLLVVGLADLAAGALASWPVAVLGVLLVAAAVTGAGRRLETELETEAVTDESTGTPDVAGRPGPIGRAEVVAARRVRAFGARHGGGGRADAGVDLVVEHLGGGLARLVLVGADGAFGDVVVRGPARAERAARLSGARVHESFPAELVARWSSGPYEWRRMAGQQLRGAP